MNLRSINAKPALVILAVALLWCIWRACGQRAADYEQRMWDDGAKQINAVQTK